MSLNGKARPDCYYASNPYHECTETCVGRIAEGKGRTNKKKKDNGRIRKDVVLNQKYDEKRVHQACNKASNPYHVCNENCYKTIAGAEGQEGIKEPASLLNIKLGRKKLNESRTMPPREIVNIPARDKVYNYSASLPPTRFPPSDKVQTLNGEHYSSDTLQLQNGEYHSSDIHAEEIHEEDPSYADKLIHFPYLVPASGILAKAAHTKDRQADRPKDPPKEAVNPIAIEPPIHHKENGNHHELAGGGPSPNKGETRKRTTGSPSGSLSFTFSGVADSDDDEPESIFSDASVSLGKYRVKGRLSPILQSIFDKYGDIAANCQLESIAMRSYYLECVCFVVQELQAKETMQLSKSKIKEMLAILKDAESIGMDVSWLRCVLSENAETLELISEHQAMEVAKTNCENERESTRKKLESQMEDLALKEKEVADAQRLIAESKAQLRELELKSSVLTDTVSSIKSKVEALNGKSVLDGVL